MKKINDLESYWMPFTANRDFKKDPGLFALLKECIIKVKKVTIS